MNEKFKIIFMGTPDFAVPALTILHQNSYDVALAVTQPDKPKGRGRKLLSPPVKETAVRLGYEVIQPESARTPEFKEQIEILKPDLFVVVAFGHILPKYILDIPALGAINIHASLLPKYRGPAPIQRAVINGEKETGITTMLMDKGLDTGDILLSEKIEIASDDTSAALHDRLSLIGAELLIKTLKRFEARDIKPIPQDHSQATYAPILSKKDGLIVWNQPSHAIERLIRGVTPWPGAYTFHGENRLKIFKAKPVSTDRNDSPGTVIKGFSDELRVSTADGYLSILEIQGPSGKRLSIQDFLRGYDIPVGTVFKQSPEVM